MPKLKRRLRIQPGQGLGASGETGVVSLDLPNISHASSSLSMRDENRPGEHKLFYFSYVAYPILFIPILLLSGSFRQNLSLQFTKAAPLIPDSAGTNRGLHLNLFGAKNVIDIDPKIPLEGQA